MLLGFYEKEVVESLLNASSKYNFIIDLGAADGYFAIGCLINNMYKKAYCYEQSEESRKHLFSNSIINRVENRIEIDGIANNNFHVTLKGNGVDLKKCVLLCDIEGGEFDLFDDNVLQAFKHSTIIIEVHEWHENGLEQYKELKGRASMYFKITELKTGNRDLSIYPEVASLNDNDRWLLCSEGRHHLMTWLKLEPKFY
jgi:hypothetical protein